MTQLYNTRFWSDIKLIKDKYIDNWDWTFLSDKTDLNFQFVKDNKQLPWDYKVLSNHKNIDWNYILNNMELSWDYDILFNRTDFNWDLFESKIFCDYINTKYSVYYLIRKETFEFDYILKYNNFNWNLSDISYILTNKHSDIKYKFNIDKQKLIDFIYENPTLEWNWYFLTCSEHFDYNWWCLMSKHEDINYIIQKIINNNLYCVYNMKVNFNERFLRENFKKYNWTNTY
jgi:hypothetical protein